MASSKGNRAYEDSYHSFTTSQSLDLSRCSKSSDVWPGGAVFGDRGPNAHHDSPRMVRSSAPFGLELSIDMAFREFWPFEPVELDIELKVLGGIDRTFRVLNRIDPGYEQFRIWIENPSGERRLYRSPRRYCSTNNRRTIAPGRSFKRDISIFGEAGSYTFRDHGVHQIWAELDGVREQPLRSNRIEVNIKAPSESPLYRTAHAVLASPTSAELLYHRLVRCSKDEISRLMDFAEGASEWHAVGNIEYGLGRALIRNSVEVDPENASTLAATGRKWLSRARDRKLLGQNQRACAQQILDEHSSYVT
jgi:hypothetical protein